MPLSGFRTARICSAFFGKWLVSVFLALSTFAFAAEENPTNSSAEFVAGANGDLDPEARQINDDEARVVFIQDGKVVGEDAYQTGEVDVIVQFDGKPVLSQTKSLGADKLRELMNLRQKTGPLKGWIIEAENAALKKRGKARKQDREILKSEFFGVFVGAAARVQKEVIEDIEKLPGVKKVWRDGKAQALDNNSNQVIRAPMVWSNLGITGSGMVVAILDTGIDYTHPDLGGCLGPACKVIGGHDFVNNDSDPRDDHGHGTHCAGIVAANGTLRGVAPDARLMAVKVLGSGGSGSFSWIIAGIDWAADPDGNPATDDGADVISMSLGGSGNPDDAISQAVDNAVAAGVVVVVAAGNSGSNYESVQSPGVARKALTVGATDNNNQLASFSSRGPVPGTWQIKPEVTAPGVNIYSTYLNGAFVPMSGTSMATPHVAGAVALLRQRYPSADPEWIKNALRQKAVNLGLNTFAQGSGRIDVYGSATIGALASSSALSLGVDDKTEAYFRKNETLTLSNLSGGSKTYSLSIAGTLPAGVTANVSPSTLTLAAGETKSFALDLSVNNSIAPDSMTTLDLSQPYNYEGRIQATAGTDTVGIPFAFFKSPKLTIQFDSAPMFVLVHSFGGGPVRMSSPSGNYDALVPVGAYSVVTWFNYNTTDVKENISVTSTATVSMSPLNAIYPVQIIPTGANGGQINIQRGLEMRYFEVKDSGWAVGVSAGSTQGTHYFAPMSSVYLFEMSMLANPYPVVGPSYLFHAYAGNGINAPVTFHNASADFRHVINQHHVDSGLTTVYPRTAAGMQFTTGSAWYSYFGYTCSDAPLAPPFQEELYLQPPPYPQFHTGYIKKTVYGSTSNSMCSGSWPLQYGTPYLRAKDTHELDAFWFGNYFPAPQFATTSPVLYSGIGPYSWYGRFQNFSGFIYLNWDAEYPFASQSRDERPPTANQSLPFELYQNGSFLGSGSFSGSYGYISVTSGIYTLKLTMNNFTVNGAPGLATVNATFDLRLPDPRPPSLTQLRLLRNGKPVDTISGGELLQFEIGDDSSGIAGASLLYNRGDEWEELVLTSPSANVYRATMPAPLSLGVPVSIRIVATDAAGNILQFETQVASPEIIIPHAAPNDFDGDAISDIVVFRPGTGYWHVFAGESVPPISVHWGTASDWKIPGDYNGDGLAEMAVWRPGSGVWYILRSGSDYARTAWGISGDVPVAADYDGDGKTDIAVFRPGSGVWYVLPSGSPGSYKATHWGLGTDIPIPGDYDGDGKSDFAVRRPSTGVSYILKSSVENSFISAKWGIASDIPVPGDYDGDTKTDIAVWRPSNAVWYVQPSGTPPTFTSTRWGTLGDQPVSGDYDGDGLSDIGVWRPSKAVWYIRPSGSPGSYTTRKWGASTDIPISSLTGILSSIP